MLHTKRAVACLHEGALGLFPLNSPVLSPLPMVLALFPSGSHTSKMGYKRVYGMID